MRSMTQYDLCVGLSLLWPLVLSSGLCLAALMVRNQATGAIGHYGAIELVATVHSVRAGRRILHMAGIQSAPIVIAFDIDAGVPGRGHRKTFLTEPTMLLERPMARTPLASLALSILPADHSERIFVRAENDADKMF